MFHKVLNFIFPKDYSCLGCNRDIFDRPELFCNKCLKDLPFLNGNICLHCGEPLVSEGNYCKRCKGRKFYFDRAIASFKYDEVIKNLVQSLKYNNAKYIAISFGKFMANNIHQTKLYADMIIPVPISKKRLKDRGYNQSKLLADEMSKQIKIEVRDDILLRVKDSPDQKDLSYSERQTNLIDAFKVSDSKYIKNKTIIIVDDVYTTGATVTECARTLKNSGAKVIYVVTVAHTILEKKDEEI